MDKYIIVPIVEGRGEQAAAPILLRNWLRFRRYDRHVDVDPKGPVYAGGKGNLVTTHDADLGRGIEHFASLAWLRQPDAILVLLDADEDCPVTLAASLLARARTQVPSDCPIGVVVANRKYEAWFLAAFASKVFRDSLMSQRYVLKQNRLPQGLNVEAISGCERRLEELIDFGQGDSAGRRTAGYKKTKHQAELTSLLPFGRFMTRRSPSFGRLLRVLDVLLSQARRRRETARRRRTP